MWSLVCLIQSFISRTLLSMGTGAILHPRINVVQKSGRIWTHAKCLPHCLTHPTIVREGQMESTFKKHWRTRHHDVIKVLSNWSAAPGSINLLLWLPLSIRIPWIFGHYYEFCRTVFGWLIDTWHWRWFLFWVKQISCSLRQYGSLSGDSRSF